MKKININEIILQIIFFISGIYLLFNILIPVFNPTSISTNSATKTNDFYLQVLNKANVTLDIANVNDNQNTTSVSSNLFTYFSGIDFSKPITYISSQLPILNYINLESLVQNPGEPVVVVPRDTTENDEEDSSNTDGNTNIIPNSGSSANTTTKTKPKTTEPSKTNNNANPGLLTNVAPSKILVNKKKLNKTKPVVLILHTHTTECYNPDKLKDKNFSTDLNTTVARIGDALDYELETRYGVSVIHDSTIHDLPKRLGAYEKSRPTVQKYLKKYPGLKLIIDLHRDGEVKRNIDTAIINNEKYARVMFVAGINFKNHEKYNKVTQKLETEFDYLYSGFSRGIDYKNGKYNQDLSPNMVLLEVGSNENSLDEALRSTSVVAKVIAKYLD